MTPNMALQRTRGLSAAQILWFAGRGSAGQNLSVRRSPLNAVALGGSARMAMVLLLLATQMLITGPLSAVAKQKGEPKVVPPVLLKSVEPKLPKGAEAIPITLEARITASGDVENVKVLQSRKPELNEFYVAALKQYKYKPATLDGKPVPVLLTVTVTVHYR